LITQLYFEGSWLFKVFSEVSLLVIDYKHLVIDYKIQNSNFKTLLKSLFPNLSLARNRLHCVVIDYQCLWSLGNNLFWGKNQSTSEIVWGLIFFLILFVWPWINLEAMLNLWMFVETTLFDSTLASSKPYIIHKWQYFLKIFMHVIC